MVGEISSGNRTGDPVLRQQAAGRALRKLELPADVEIINVAPERTGRVLPGIIDLTTDTEQPRSITTAGIPAAEDFGTLIIDEDHHFQGENPQQQGEIK